MFTFFTDHPSFLLAYQATCTLCGLTSMFLAIRAKVANFWVGYLYSVLLFPLFLYKGYYLSMLLQPISFVITVFGHYRWTHPRGNEENEQHKLRITVLNGWQRLWLLLIMAALTVALWQAVSHLHLWIPAIPKAGQPFLEAFVLVMILTAQWLSAQKKLDCWAAWMTVNITNAARFPFAGLSLLSVEYLVKMIMASFGFFHWLKKYKRENR